MYNNKQKCGIHLQFAESGYICGFRLQVLRVLLIFCGVHVQLRNPEQLPIFACCGILNRKMCRQNLRYEYLNKEFSIILLVESTYLLEHT